MVQFFGLARAAAQMLAMSMISASGPMVDEIQPVRQRAPLGKRSARNITGSTAATQPMSHNHTRAKARRQRQLARQAAKA